MKSSKESIEVLHQQFQKKHKREKWKVHTFQLAIFLVFFSSWEISSKAGWIDPLIFSSPSAVWSLFIEKIADGSLGEHIGVTLFETILGFLLGTFLGTCLAALLWWSNKLARIFDPYLVVLNAMPKVALGPILIVALGPSFISIIAMGAVISVIITAIVVYTAFQEVDENYLKVMNTFGAKKRVIFKEVILPASSPAIISTLKVNVGLSWVGVIVGEFLVSAKGLGYMIIYGFQVFNFTLVFLSLFIIAIFATLMYQGVELLEKKWTKGRSDHR
ncbi:ABC transporter permease [Bacillus atrophaeus]|uniref:ABC transporter permease n=1 Tax=Bacillus atrophaeus TaxID=1452 RepID=UPI000B455E3B|nr:ABC transporter permease [Bacillus atrophaeus]ARW07990.1 putative ABC transporter permease protein YtlD [Bacillus atrophaeus]